ncbi:hypothetical protein [Methyloceanibacter caenitepidi]|uniref:Uncharacterized protein n=1 Tax=Methyloceanibacter caenitepidi TaxID=1384459 RepID=A0A0A8K6U7_9HYPH|nr:hypothetical protein [Methyloceanibacter caenitepidi]BAQ18645.1 hypothetical protein GL4_3214 [Methyloceanibacter caenitepidi]
MSKYTGVLNEPLEVEDGPEAYWERVEALADHYGIDLHEDAGWMRLAIELAATHVPGFQMKPTSLPVEGLTARDAASLTRLIEHIKEARSARRAAARLEKARTDLDLDNADAVTAWLEGFMDPANGSYDKRRAMAFIFMRYGA